MAFWNRIKEIFQQAEASTPANPTIHEVITRSPAEQTAYERWKQTTAPQRLLAWVSEQYTGHRARQRTDESIDFLDTTSTKGVVIHFHQTNYSREEIGYFFDLLKEKVQALGYRSDLSDRRIFPRRDWVETQERHYLKPRVDFNEEQLNQAFGNITIELELRNDVAYNLRLRATTYNDALFERSISFAGLITAITT